MTDEEEEEIAQHLLKEIKDLVNRLILLNQPTFSPYEQAEATGDKLPPVKTGE